MFDSKCFVPMFHSTDWIKVRSGFDHINICSWECLVVKAVGTVFDFVRKVVITTMES